METMAPIIAEMLEKNGKVTFRVSGWSMQPMLYDKRDDVTLVKPNFPLKKYDLPLYKTLDERYFLHRIIKVNDDGSYFCRGDNRWSGESPIYDDQIIGVVCSFNRKGKEIFVGKSLGYYIYTRIWPILHHLKFLHKYWRRLKKSLKCRLEEFIKPQRETVVKEDGNMIEIDYRLARHSDLERIKELLCKLAEYEAKQLNDSIKSPAWPYTPMAESYFKDCIDNHFFYVAVCNKKIIGCLSGKISNQQTENFPVAKCGNVYVDDEYRGVGIATKMLEAFKSYCIKRNCHHIKISFMENNENAKRLYQKNGFKPYNSTFLCELKEQE